MAETLQVEIHGTVARVTLARPEVRNAFDAPLIAALRGAFEQLGGETAIRTIVLSGEGKAFSGGADVNWMRAALDLDETANRHDAEAMSDMFRTIDRCPKAVIVRVQGAALGGGAGLCAVGDVVIAADDAIFGFTETKLGILPAVISPFVVAKIGASHARALFLTGERFSAERAQAIGLVHEVCAADALDARVERVVDELRSAGPSAIAAAKRLINDVRAATYSETRGLTAGAIARQRISPEGQEGLRAFLERRTATWVDR
jgi:methylglutaconyl-CoA hydratase